MKNFNYKEYLAEGWLFKSDEQRKKRLNEAEGAEGSGIAAMVDKFTMLSDEYKNELLKHFENDYQWEGMSYEELMEDGDFCEELCTKIEDDISDFCRKNIFNWSDDEIRSSHFETR